MLRSDSVRPKPLPSKVGGPDAYVQAKRSIETFHVTRLTYVRGAQDARSSYREEW